MFDGYLHYRGIVEGEPYLDRPHHGGRRPSHAPRHPLSDRRAAGRQGADQLARLYAEFRRARRRSKPGILRADRDVAAEAFRGWSYPWLDIHGLFARTERVLQLPNVDRDPIPRWSFGRVTLIGDAAHPMQPVGAQAGSQAVVDGRVLAASLARDQ